MNNNLKLIIWRQFGAAIDTLGNAVRACPDELWHECLWRNPSVQAEFSQFWYIVYHTLFWLDLYLYGEVEGFAPPVPFTLEELDADGAPPETPYTKDELLAYLVDCRQKCQATIETLTEEDAQRHCQFPWGEVTFAELLLYNMRHVQEHAAQLNLMIGQKTGSGSDWVLWANEQG